MARFPNARAFLKAALKMLLDDKKINSQYHFVKFYDYVFGQQSSYPTQQDKEDFKFVYNILSDTYKHCSETLKIQLAETQFGYPSPPEMDRQEIIIWEPMDIDVKEFSFFFEAFEEDYLVKETSIKPIDPPKI
jgi:hypothetical protein